MNLKCPDCRKRSVPAHNDDTPHFLICGECANVVMSFNGVAQTVPAKALLIMAVESPDFTDKLGSDWADLWEQIGVKELERLGKTTG